MFGAYLPEKPRRVLVLGSGALQIGQAGEFDYSGSQAIKALQGGGHRHRPGQPEHRDDPDERGAGRPHLPRRGHARVRRADHRQGRASTPSCSPSADRPRSTAASRCDDARRAREARRARARHADRGDPRHGGPRALRRAARTRSASRPRAARACRIAGGGARGAIDDRPAGHAARRLRARRQGQRHRRDATRSSTRRCGAPSPAASRRCSSRSASRGWKEIEYEVVRDARDNCITVCNMENFDPMGIHTGESIVVAPSQTLNDEEYQLLRIDRDQDRSATSASSASATSSTRSIPQSLDYRVIEVNARLSRSSALASKATGYPLAYVAAKLALGYALPEIPNGITRRTTAFFEPALDYLVCKVPRWDLDEVPRRRRCSIGSEMKSVGEVMAIGRTFPEVIQKALRMLDIGVARPRSRRVRLRRPARRAAARRRRCAIFAIAQALRDGMSVDEIHELTRIDRWFLRAIEPIVAMHGASAAQRACRSTPTLLREAKALGFSDQAIERLARRRARSACARRAGARAFAPHFAQIDTLAAEFPAETNYLYSTYHASAHDVAPSHRRKKILVLGSGAYRIGSSVEFDWCCRQRGAGGRRRSATRRSCSTTTRRRSAPTTTSATGSCFDEISLEIGARPLRARAARRRRRQHGRPDPEQPRAAPAPGRACKILGTQRREHRPRRGPQQVQRAARRARHRSAALVARHRRGGRRRRSSSELGGFPVLVRPSYVLSGAAMSVAHEPNELRRILARAKRRLARAPGRRLEVRDARARESRSTPSPTTASWCCGRSASTSRTPACTAATRRWCCRRRRSTSRRSAASGRSRQRSRARCEITGPFNVQFLAKHNAVKVIECNLRASRSFPFVSKVTGENFAAEAMRRMLGHSREIVEQQPRSRLRRRQGADVLVLAAAPAPIRCSASRWRAPARSAASATTCTRRCCTALLATGFRFPRRGVLLSLGPVADKYWFADEARVIAERARGCRSTRRPARPDAAARSASPARSSARAGQATSRARASMIDEGQVDLVINIPREYDAARPAGRLPDPAPRGRRRRAADHRPAARARGRRGAALAQARHAGARRVERLPGRRRARRAWARRPLKRHCPRREPARFRTARPNAR